MMKREYDILHQPNGPSLGYSPNSGVKLIEREGLWFKDLSRDGVLHPYEDWRLPAEERARDLASRLSTEEIAGLMLYSSHQAVPTDASVTAEQLRFLKEDHVRAVLVTKVPSPRMAARWSNRVQALVEGLGHGIPANNSSDPRNETSTADEFLAGAGGQISLWPRPIGLAAIMDPTLIRTFGEIASREYRALGITTALSPQVDIASEPRWRRVLGTFGEDPQLVTDYTQAYCDGFQTSRGEREITGGWGYESVNCMAKHWPNGGSEEGGRDAHYCFGKYQVYPAGQFDNRLQPFTEGAFRLQGPTRQASAVMGYYTVPWNIAPNGENVAQNYSRYIIGDLLRGRLGYEGVVCTDWLVTADYPDVNRHHGKPWGVEYMTVAERHYRALQAGVDMFGGNQDKEPVLEAYRMWVRDYGEDAARERFERSARRLLLNIFRLGLFENAYLDEDESERLVGNPDFMRQGYEAQLRSIVMLKNRSRLLPLSRKTKVFMPKRIYPGRVGFWRERYERKEEYPIRPELLGEFFEVVDSPDKADVAIVDIDEPLGGYGYSEEDRKTGNGYVPVSLQYRSYTADLAREHSLAGGDPKEPSADRSYRGKTVTTDNESDLDLVIQTKRQMGNKPVVVIVNLTRPMVMAELEPYADAILLCFGVQNRAKMELLSGNHEPEGLLPFQLPRDMQTVETQAEDLSHDMIPYTDSANHTYDFAFGLNWHGVIDDNRTKRYKPFVRRS